MQLGLISKKNAIASGISEFAVYPKVRRGKWQELFHGVYLPSPELPTREQTLMAACMWADGVVSHRTAAGLYRLLETSLIEVTTLRQVRSRRDDLVVHRVRSIDDRHLTRIGLIPITSPVRTIIDVAGVVDRPTLQDVLYRAVQGGLTTPRRIEVALTQPAHGKEGMAELRSILEEGLDSHLERLLRPLLKSSNLPRFVAQHRVDMPDGKQFFVDFAYPNKRIAIETDGWAFHSDRAAFQSDRRRWRQLASLGWTILWFTYEDITLRPEEVIATIAAALRNVVPRGA